GKVLRERKRRGNPALALLVGVVEVREAELAPVAQEAQEVARVVPARDQEDVRDAGVDEGLEPVVDHGPVEHGQEMLVGDPGERQEPRAQATGEYDPLHRTPGGPLAHGAARINPPADLATVSLGRGDGSGSV